MTTRRKLFDSFDIKAEETAEPYFEGYASVFGNVDRYGERVNKGAFAATLKSQKGVVPLFWMHQEPIGVATAEEDDHGLKVVGYPLVADVRRAAEVMALMRKRDLPGGKSGAAVREMSFGFRVEKGGAARGADGVLDLTKLSLTEVTVGFNAVNPSARVTRVKAGELSWEQIRDSLVAGDSFDEDLAELIAKAALPVVRSDHMKGSDVVDSIQRAINALRA